MHVHLNVSSLTALTWGFTISDNLQENRKNYQLQIIKDSPQLLGMICEQDNLPFVFYTYGLGWTTQ